MSGIAAPSSTMVRVFAPRMHFGLDQAEAFRAHRHELETDFADWLERHHLHADPDEFGLLLEWKWGCGDGQLDRWRCADLSEFLLGWCPRRLMVEEQHPLVSVPAAARLGMLFLADRGLLDAASDPVDALVACANGLVDVFGIAMTDPASFGMAKSIMAALGVDDLSTLTPDYLHWLMEEFNALPEDVRRSITDPVLRALQAELPELRFGPVRLADEAELRDLASTGPVLTAFGRLADYLAPPGRLLTRYGNLRIADARALSALLGTGDVYEERIGDRVFRRRSATEFIELDHWQWWARTSRAIRKHRNRLVAVEAWQQRVRNDPLAELAAAFDVLLDHGVLGSYDVGSTRLERLLDSTVAAMLCGLLQSPGPAEFEDLLRRWHQLAQVSGIEPVWPGQLRSALDRMLGLLERFGVLDQEHMLDTPSSYGGSEQAGGTVSLTPIGAYLTVRALRNSGFDIVVLPPAERLGVDDLAGLAIEQRVHPAAWWSETWSWSDLQPDPHAALAAVLTRLAGTHPSYLVLALHHLPEHDEQRLAPLLRRLAAGEPAGPAKVAEHSMAWLFQRGLVDAAGYTASHLVRAQAGGRLALPGDDDELIAMMAEGRTVEEQLELVRAVAAHGGLAALQVLETIGRAHTNKTVSRAARKAVFTFRNHPEGLSRRSRQG